MKHALNYLGLFVLLSATLSFAPKPAETHWVDINDLPAKLKQYPRPVVVEMYATWCGWCKKMDKTTFADPEIAALVNEAVYMVKINGETTTPFTFLGKTTNGKEMVKALGIQGYPTFLLVDEGQEKIEIVEGYKTAPQLKRIVTKLTK